jgi:hypothetical protein
MKEAAVMTIGSSAELEAVEQRLAENEPAEAEPVRELRTLVAEIATSQQPASLAELRHMIDVHGDVPEKRRGLLQYVLMDMLDRRELEISDDRRLIIHLAA